MYDLAFWVSNLPSGIVVGVAKTQERQLAVKAKRQLLTAANLL